ncbi:hypothetical protein NMG60_11001224 [Bertholletia excelsa]
MSWPLQDTMSYKQNIYEEREYSHQSFIHPPFNGSNERADATKAKKFNYNASERDRCKKINSLYSSLRSLLPASDQSKKLSTPATISRVLKYIPELQKEIERLVQKKEHLMSRISRQEDLAPLARPENCASPISLNAVVASPVGDAEFAVQICAAELCGQNSLSVILLNLEEDGGLLLLNARVFYNLPL